MSVSYHNPWIPAAALKLLEDEPGTILDVGGGAAPYYRAAHVIDIQPFDAERLKQNAWGASPLVADDETEDRECETWKVEREMSERDQEKGTPLLRSTEKNQAHLRTSRESLRSSQYTQLDICNGERWPFADKQFDLGLSSHCLEDIRDPVQVVKEMGRCCKKVLMVCPSRLFEQMRGVDHPRYCGMDHHLWLVEEQNGELKFRRKTQLMEFAGMHLNLPVGKKIKVESGSMFYYSTRPTAKEVMFFDQQENMRDYREFVQRHTDLAIHLEPDPQWKSWRRWWWYFRQRWRLEV